MPDVLKCATPGAAAFDTTTFALSPLMTMVGRGWSRLQEPPTVTKAVPSARTSVRANGEPVGAWDILTVKYLGMPMFTSQKGVDALL